MSATWTFNGQSIGLSAGMPAFVRCELVHEQDRLVSFIKQDARGRQRGGKRSGEKPR